MVFNIKQGKESLICVEVGYKNLSLEITDCLRSASLMKTNGDHRNVFFNPTLTLMIYILIFFQVNVAMEVKRCVKKILARLQPIRVQ